MEKSRFSEEKLPRPYSSLGDLTIQEFTEPGCPNLAAGGNESPVLHGLVSEEVSEVANFQFPLVWFPGRYDKIKNQILARQK